MRTMLEYLCRDWNLHHESKDRLVHVELGIVVEAIPEPDTAWDRPRIERGLANQD